MRRQRQVKFSYQSFTSPEAKQYQADPVMLLEYRNRWYLAGWDPADQRFKTYGLERMLEPEVTAFPAHQNRQAQFLKLKESALGVFIGPENLPTKVSLWVSRTMAPYLTSVPMHQSQNIVAEDESGIVIELKIVINPELENVILGNGEHIEVFEPAELRDKIRARAIAMVGRYTNQGPD